MWLISLMRIHNLESSLAKFSINCLTQNSYLLKSQFVEKTFYLLLYKITLEQLSAFFRTIKCTFSTQVFFCKSYKECLKLLFYKEICLE